MIIEINVIIIPKKEDQWIPSIYILLKGYKNLGPLHPLNFSRCGKNTSNIIDIIGI